jgi:hypothetical protein
MRRIRVPEPYEEAIRTVQPMLVAVLLIISSTLSAHAGPPPQEPLPEGRTLASGISTSTETVPWFGEEGIPIRPAGGQFDWLSGPVPDPVAGMTGYQAPYGPQPYALVVPGAGESVQTQAAGVALEPNRSSTANPGTAITYTHTLTNTGNQTDTFELDYSSSQGWAQVSPTSFITLANGATQTVLVAITVPSDAISGTLDTTVITATSQAVPGVSDTAIDTTTVRVGGDIYLPIILSKGSSVTPPLPSLANGDFEAGRDGSWTEYSKNGFDLIVDDFGTNEATPHSGDWGVWLGGAFDEVSELSQQVSIPAGASSLSLTYWYWIASDDDCGYDHGWFEVNGAKLESYDLCISYNTGGWTKETVNFEGYAGQTVTIKFHADTDSAWNSNLFLDDVAFQASSSATGDISHRPLTPSTPDLSNARSRP